MSEQIITVETTGIELCYETFGSRSDPPLVLVMGLGTQMIGWPDELCADLGTRGYYVIRFDNRDVGHSSHLSHLPAPDPVRVLLGRTRTPYGLVEMARDTIGLFDVLGLSSVHLVGASMGGFIAQLVAISAPERVRSLGLIMTSTGSRRAGLPHPRIAVRFSRRRGRDPLADRTAAISAVTEVFSAIGSPGFPSEVGYLREVAGRAYDRNYDPDGYLRQLGAVLAQQDRTLALRQLSMPAVVIHGVSDPLVRVSGGKALARAIPGARLVTLNGMGHSLPKPLWPVYAAELARTAADGERRRAPATQLDGASTSGSEPE